MTKDYKKHKLEKLINYDHDECVCVNTKLKYIYIF